MRTILALVLWTVVATVQMWSPASAQPSWTQPGVATGINIPQGAQPITASGTATTGPATASLLANPNRLTYICGFVITSGGTTTAAVGLATVAGIVNGPMSFQYVSVSSGQGLLGVAFPQCIPGNANNTAIVVTTPSGGVGTVMAASAWGYQF